MYSNSYHILRNLAKSITVKQSFQIQKVNLYMNDTKMSDRSKENKYINKYNIDVCILSSVMKTNETKDIDKNSEN